MLQSELKKYIDSWENYPFLEILKMYFLDSIFFHVFGFQKLIMFEHSSCLDDRISQDI